MAAGDPVPGQLAVGEFFVNFTTGRQFIGVPVSIASSGFKLISDHYAQETALAGKVSAADLTSGLAGKANTAHTHEMADVNGLIDALAAAGGSSSAFVPGMIVMWGGSVNAIPSGWALCDGVDGRPDLRNRFIVGAGTGSDYVVGQKGGANQKTVTSSLSGQHSHGGATGGTVLTTIHLPSHSHGVNDPGHGHSITDPGHDHKINWSSGFSTGSSFVRSGALSGSDGAGIATAKTGISINGAGTNISLLTTGGDQAHNHTISTEASHNHDVSIDVRPLFYALCFIIKVVAS